MRITGAPMNRPTSPVMITTAMRATSQGSSGVILGEVAAVSTAAV